MFRIDAMYQCKIEKEDRGNWGIYSIVYARCPYESNKWEKIGVLAPGMKLSKSMFYSMLAMSNKRGA